MSKKIIRKQIRIFEKPWEIKRSGGQKIGF